MYSAGIGSFKIKFLNDKGTQTVVALDNVLYTPSFKENLLFAKRLLATGFKILFYGLNCEILYMRNMIRLALRNVLTVCINLKRKEVRML